MTVSYNSPPAKSDKSRSVATTLAAFLGPFGAHRFYLGKPESGVLMLLTLGGLGVWWLYDLILIASGSFRDGDGRLVTRWDSEGASPAGSLPQEVYAELDAMRSEISELAERLDFAERLLAKPRDDRAEPHSIRPS